MKNISNIFDYIKEEEVSYSQPVELIDGWNWSMKDHIKRSFLYINSQFYEDNENRWLRPFKNIVLPILNIQHRTEGFDVKDITLYVNNKDEYYKSLLISKYHEKWAIDNEIDTFIDDLVESFCDYGGALVRKTKSVRPEVIDLRSLAFCNQHDIINNPFAILHQMSFAELRREAKARGWGGEGSDIDVESLIELVKREDKTTVDIYEVHGSMPKEWLTFEEDFESEMDVDQIQIVAFYFDENKERKGVSLFKKEMDTQSVFKFISRDKVYNRALGRGGVEELFDPQEWTNWNEVKLTEMRNSASKTLFISDDPTFKSKNNLNNVQNNEVLSVQDGKTVVQLDTFPRNLAVFNDSVDRFWQHAQLLGSAPEPLLGETPSSGTPFKLYEAQQIEGQGMHKYRQGKLAVFMDEIYRDWILPHLAKEIVKEQNFLQELSVDEIEQVVDAVLTKKANQLRVAAALSMQIIDEDLITLQKDVIRQQELKKGNKRFFQILKDELKDVELAVSTNIAGKQKNLSLLTDKLVNVFRQFMATPQLRQDPEMVKLFNAVLESAGLSPIKFGPAVIPAQPAPQQATAPAQQLSEVNQQPAV